ncbi:MAG: hypothetical protein ACQR33_00370 [Candidatus Saccharibacteria bacterium]
MSVQPQPSFTFIKLFIRALMPSSASIITAMLLALTIIGGHMLLVTLNGDVQPSTLDPQALNTYNTAIIDPLLRLTNSTTLNNGLGVVMWGLFGWVLYELVSLAASAISNWRMAKSEVRIARGTIVSSPMQRTLFVRFAWRFAVAVGLSAFTIAMLPVMHYCLANDYHALSASRFATSWPYALRSLGTWILVFHGYLILLRLYMQRTRVFGEIIY